MAKVLGSFSWLCRHSHPISVFGDNVAVLHTPGDFYRTLIEQIKTANNRILLSSLYLGTGELEKDLVSILGSVLHDKRNVECTILLDYLRGNRGLPNSVSLLQNILASLAKKIMPQRFNEVVGLQHTKIYLFDDNVMFSGANLSEDYFTNRRDRYLIFKHSPELADFIAAIHRIICDHSYNINYDGTTISPANDPLKSRKCLNEYKSSFEKAISCVINPSSDLSRTDSHANTDSATRTDSNANTDTIVFPLVQMGDYNIKQDEVVTRELLSDVKSNERIYLSSGYFNLPPQYMEAILKNEGECRILASSPQAMGFFNAEGVAKYVPHMYMYFACQFLQEVNKLNQLDRVKYFEYFQEGWTFHSKGIWYYTSNDHLPSLTLMGSSNYGHRSLTRDLEMQVAIVTKNEELRRALHDEKNLMFDYGKQVTLGTVLHDSDRQLPLLVQLVTKLLKHYV